MTFPAKPKHIIPARGRPAKSTKKVNSSLFDIRKDEKVLKQFKVDKDREYFLIESHDMFGIPFNSVEMIDRGKRTVIDTKKNNPNAAYQVYHRIEMKYMWG